MPSIDMSGCPCCGSDCPCALDKRTPDLQLVASGLDCLEAASPIALPYIGPIPGTLHAWQADISSLPCEGCFTIHEIIVVCDADTRSMRIRIAVECTDPEEGGKQGLYQGALDVVSCSPLVLQKAGISATGGCAALCGMPSFMAVVSE